jgi:hypothetical protein
MQHQDSAKNYVEIVEVVSLQRRLLSQFGSMQMLFRCYCISDQTPDELLRAVLKKMPSICTIYVIKASHSPVRWSFTFPVL